jgi:hypothetical protein
VGRLGIHANHHAIGVALEAYAAVVARFADEHALLAVRGLIGTCDLDRHVAGGWVEVQARQDRARWALTFRPQNRGNALISGVERHLGVARGAQHERAVFARQLELPLAVAALVAA